MVDRIKVGFYRGGDCSSVADCDIVLVAQSVFQVVSFQSELSGKTEVLAEIGRLSLKLKAIVFSGIISNNYGLLCPSVVTAYKGKLLGICDSTRALDKEYLPFAGQKIFETDKGRFGVLVHRDLCVFDAVKALASLECDAIIDISADLCDFNSEMLTQTMAYLGGIAIVNYAGDKLIAATPLGELKKNSEEECGSFLLSTKRRYRTVNYKSRSLY